MSEYFVGSTGANNQTTFESLSTSEVLDDLQLNTTHSPTFNGLTVGNHVLPNADSTIDLGTNSTRFANVYADTLYGDGSNLTNLPSGADNTKLPLAGGTMTGAIDSHASDSGVILKSGNSSATGNPDQFFLRHNLGNVELGNSRGNINITSGNVGIGTASPSHKLDIYSNENVPLRIHRPSNANLNSSGAWGIGFSTRGDAVTSTTDTRAGIFSYYNGNLFLATNSTSIVSDPDAYARLTVTAAGNVGIGTGATAPADKLTIQEDSADFSIRKTDGTLSARIVQFGSGASELRQYDASGSQKVSINTVGDSYFNGGNVGIGATIPSSLLHINAADGVMVDTFTAYIRNQEATAGDNFGLGIQAGSNSSDVSLQVSDKAGTSLLRVRGDGNVGIGTTSPASLLHISSSTSGDAVLTIEADTDNNDENDNPYIHFKQDGGGVTAKVGIEGTNGLTFTNSLGNHAYLGSEQNHGVQLYANGAAGLTLRGGGDIGIGTNAPETKLHVYKSSATSGTSTGTSVLRLQNYVGSDLSQQKVFADFVLADDNANEIPQVRIGAEVGQNGDADSQVKEGSGAFVVYTNNADTTSGDAGASLAERMRVDYQGNVGIGTTSPSFKLDVNGTANIATHLVTPLIYSGGGNIVFGNVAQFNANVGIGTTSPDEKLHVDGSFKVGDYMKMVSSSGYMGMIGFNRDVSSGAIYNSSYGAYQIHNNNGKLYLQVYNSSGVSVTQHAFDNNGNVGIGTTSPAYKLEVDGTSKISPSSSQPALYLDRATGQPNIKATTTDGYMIIDSSSNYLSLNHYVNKDVILASGGGNVGIGTTSPAYKLDVNGHTRINESELNITSSSSAYTTHFNYQDGGSNAISHASGASTIFRESSNTLVTISNGTYKLDVAGAIRANGNIATTSASQIMASRKFSALNTSGVMLTDSGASNGLSIANGGNATFSHDLTVSGNLTVSGTTTTINSTTISVDDKNIELGSVSAPDTSTADGGGITLLAGSNESDHKTIKWINSTDAWTFNTNVSASGLDINGAADISGHLEVGEYILRSGQGSNYHRFLASRQIFVVGNASSIDLNNGTSTFGATGGATTLQGSSLLLDSADAIVLDADDDGSVKFKDAGTEFGRIYNAGSNFYIKSIVSDKDLVFVGNDGGTAVEALRLDMSNGGNATFAGTVTATSLIKSGGSSSEFLKADGSVDSSTYISSETYSTPSQLLTAIKTVDGSGSGLDADTLDGVSSGSFLRSDANDTVTGEITGSGDPSLSGFFLPQNPEGRHVKAPWFFNDMAYARLKGATVSVTVTGGSSPGTTDIDAMFDASTGFWNMPTSGVTEVVIEMTNLPKTMYHGSHMGATFGNTTWRPKDIKLESYYNGQYNELLDVSNQSKEYVTKSYNSGGNAQSKLRWTFSNFNSTSMRIVSLFAYNYNATGMPSLYLANNGGELYGDVTLKSPTGASQSSYALKLRKTNSSSAAQAGAEITASPYTPNTNAANLVFKTANTSAVATTALTLDGVQNATFAGSVTATSLIKSGGSSSEFLKADGSVDSSTYVSSSALSSYLPLAGGTITGNVKFNDGVELRLGAGADLKIYHNSNVSRIHNELGDLYIENDANDGDIIFGADNGSGGIGEYFRLDGSQSDSGSDYRYTRWQDFSVVALGNNNDLQLWHDGANSRIENNTGNLILTNNTNDGDIIFKSDDGLGGVTPYLRLDGSHTQMLATKNLHFDDNVKALFGDYASPDLQIYHNGSHSYIDEAGTGNLYIRNGTKNSIWCQTDGAVQLYYNDSKKLETASGGVTITGNITASGGGSAPSSPASASAAVVGETVEVTFAASTTSNIDAYLVYSSIDGSDYGLISVVPPDDFASSMSIIDNAFDETGTQAYRIYASKLGKLSSAETASVSYAVSSAEPTSMSVVNLNNAYYVQWNPPSSNARFITAYNVYKHEHAVQGSLSRSSASLVYSGMNTNYMYQISGTNNNNFHQFWVETTIA